MLSCRFSAGLYGDPCSAAFPAPTVILKGEGTTNQTPQSPRRKSLLRSCIQWFVLGVAACWTLAALMLVAAKWIDPPTTAVHMERRVEAWIHGKPYHERYTFVPLKDISPNLRQR